MKRVTLFVSAGFATGLIIAACDFSEPEPTHCARSTGESVCADRYGTDRPYCTIPSCDASGEGYYGCVAEKPRDECNYACGGHRNILDDGSCSTAGDGDGDGDGDPTGDGDGDGDLPCMGPEDCTDPGAPFCDPDSGECVSCDATAEPDTSCAGLGDGSTPVCLDGSCVQCAEGKVDGCSGTTPICDVGASMCVGCSDHSQCPESACNLAAGNCIDPAAVYYVNGSDPECAMGDGSEAMPYCFIDTALSNSPPEAVIMVHAKIGDAAYQESNSIDNFTTKVLIGIPNADANPELLAFNNAPALSVIGNLMMVGIDVVGGSVAGIDVTGQAWLDACSIQDKAAQGINITGGTAIIRRSKIVNNTGGGIAVGGGGMLVLENSFVGGDVSDQHAVDIVDGSATITYSTLAAGGFSATALTCTQDTGTATVRNSLLVARTDGDELACSGATYSTTAVEMADVPGTVSLGSLPAMTSEWFTAYGDGDFFLAPNHPPAIDTAATWLTGDPATDIGTDPRPVTEGPDFAGADVVP